MLDQAVKLFSLARGLDEPYLNRRIREETAGNADFGNPEGIVVIKIKLSEYERQLELRKAALGISGQDYVRRNSGQFRTAAKRELLQRLDDRIRAEGVTPRFRGNA